MLKGAKSGDPDLLHRYDEHREPEDKYRRKDAPLLPPGSSGAGVQQLLGDRPGSSLGRRFDLAKEKSRGLAKADRIKASKLRHQEAM